jgi:hypothetical protein
LAAHGGVFADYATADGSVDCGRANFYGCGNNGPVPVKPDELPRGISGDKPDYQGRQLYQRRRKNQQPVGNASGK